MKDFAGKVAVVTGAASGIGLALSKRFAAEGMKVVLADIEAGALERAVTELPAGSESLAVVTDVARGEQVEALAARTLERFGAVHVICNNAGVGGNGRLLSQTVKDWEWILGVNLWGVIHGIRVFGPLLAAQNEGHILNTASVAGLTSPAGMSTYNVTKHSVVTLSETLYTELALEGSKVGVSVLCPGYVSTRIHESDRNRPESMKHPKVELTPKQQFEAECRRTAIAAVIAAGCSPESVAEQVVAAIRDNRFYILTHPELNPLIEQRVRQMLKGENPGVPTS